ncbi:heat shock protein 90 [Aphelenchoides besseyi]|nr:heat shock protein 90 [Aphelenchoides besseyi]
MSEQGQAFEVEKEIYDLVDVILSTVSITTDVAFIELISNESDALNKMRFEEINDPNVEARSELLWIEITLNETDKTITITDTGFGMMCIELQKLCGGLIRVRQKTLLKRFKDGKDISMIGQFGVGFYSAFLVADRVLVTSKHEDDCSVVSFARQKKAFTIHEAEDDETETKVVLELKEGVKQTNLLEERRIKEIVKKHSQFIGYPIKLVELNKTKPIWTRNPDDILNVEYVEFYQSLDDVDCQGALLFVPQRALRRMFGEQNLNVSSTVLYTVRQTEAIDNSKVLLPTYLNFVKGFVELPNAILNVADHTLTRSKMASIISEHLITQTLELLSEQATRDKDKYNKFYTDFGSRIKVGVIEDDKNREQLVRLLRYKSITSGENMRSLQEYVSRMNGHQKCIYYITGESKEVVVNSASVERVVECGYEVLLMVDSIDAYVVQKLKKYEGHELVSVTREGLELPESEEEE